MPQLYVVIRTRGPAFQRARPLEAQTDWAAHGAFMNGLVRDGAVILGGPLEGTADVLLVMRARPPTRRGASWRRIRGRFRTCCG
jgi:hypothetical protein